MSFPLGQRQRHVAPTPSTNRVEYFQYIASHMCEDEITKKRQKKASALSTSPV